MFRLLFTVIFSFFFAKLLAILFDDEYSGVNKKTEVEFMVHNKNGAIACAFEDVYYKIQEYSKNNQNDLIREEINKKNCILLKYGEKLTAFSDICDKVDHNQVKLFKSPKIFLQKIYVPCFAVKIMDNHNDINE
jgi:hypothetical protein